MASSRRRASGMYSISCTTSKTWKLEFQLWFIQVLAGFIHSRFNWVSWRSDCDEHDVQVSHLKIKSNWFIFRRARCLHHGEVSINENMLMCKTCAPQSLEARFQKEQAYSRIVWSVLGRFISVVTREREERMSHCRKSDDGQLNQTGRKEHFVH